MADPSTIRAVCSRLDPANDGHWTSQGLPRMDVLASMGLQIERRELNEALPGFCRSKLAEETAASADASASEEEATTVAAESDAAQPQPSFFLHAKRRAARRAAALEHLAKGGFSLRDLEPVRCRLERATSARNRQARRELS